MEKDNYVFIGKNKVGIEIYATPDSIFINPSFNDNADLIGIYFI